MSSDAQIVFVFLFIYGLVLVILIAYTVYSNIECEEVTWKRCVANFVIAADFAGIAQNFTYFGGDITFFKALWFLLIVSFLFALNN